MMMHYLIIFIFFFLIFCYVKWFPSHQSLSRKVFCALIVGLLFGLSIQNFFDDQVLEKSVQWFDLIGTGYIKILKSIVVPLVIVSILGSFIKLDKVNLLGKIGFLIIFILLLTTFISAFIGVSIAQLFHLSAEGLTMSHHELARLASLETNYINQVSDFSLPNMLLSLISDNLFADLMGSRPTSIIGLVFFTILLGIAYIQLREVDQEKAKSIAHFIELVQEWIMKLIRMVMLLTPIGIFALMTKIFTVSNLSDLLSFGQFIIASYIGLFCILVMHALFIGFSGVNPKTFFSKSSSVLGFAFSSRSSAASIPLNIETQTKKMGIPESVASFSATFGSSIGQNGCAGLYPAMLAVMSAPLVGIESLDFMWIMTLLVVVTISSIGIAGVGGGATFASLIVLPAMNLPIELVALFVSIEPLIDMGRTAVNVSGSMTAGLMTSRVLKIYKKEIFDN